MTEAGVLQRAHATRAAIRPRRQVGAIGLLVIAVAAAAALSLAAGSNSIGLPEVAHRLLNPAADSGAIVWGSRVPRTVLGLIVGTALGLAGAVMQGQTRNPLADPGIFGVSAGAGFAVVVGLTVAGSASLGSGLWLAIGGALVASAVVFAIGGMGRGVAGPVPLAVAGAAVSSLLIAVTSYLVLADQDTLAGYRSWVVGSLSGRSLDGSLPAIAIAAVGVVLAFANAPALDGLALGDEFARGLGQRMLLTRLVGLGAVTMLTAASVALTGPIGFIGLTAPHVARALVGGRHALLLPASALVGCVVLLVCDVVGRVIGGMAEVPVGVVLAVVGGVAFMVIVRRGRMAEL